MSDKKTDVPITAEVVRTDDETSDVSSFTRANGEDTVVGFTLLSKEQKALLVGLPFTIVGITVRDSDYSRKDGGEVKPANMVSVEAYIGHWSTEEEALARMQKALARRQITAEQFAAFDPREGVVFNGGDTGFYRQCVMYLHDKGLVKVPDGPNGGAMGESRWDTYRASWEGIHADDRDPRFVVVLNCPRGLRPSEYKHDLYGDATTYYLA